MLPFASMHLTLQIPLRTVLWQHLGDLWPLGGNFFFFFFFTLKET